MKKSVRLISIFMAAILCLSCMTAGVSAQYADYSRPASTDKLGRPVISVYQCGSMILDKIDTMLFEMNEEKDGKLKGHIGYTLDVDYDLSSIDGALHSIRSLQDCWAWDMIGTGVAGDLKRVKFGSLNRSPYRTTVGSTDLQILYAMFGFLNDNKDLIGKLVDGKWDNGSIMGTFLDMNEIVGDVHAMVKGIIFDALFKEGDKVKPGTQVTENSTLDDMVNELLYSYIAGDNAIFQRPDPEDETKVIYTLENEMVAAGMMNGPGLENFKLNDADNKNNTVYNLIRCIIRTVLSDTIKPKLRELLADNTEMLVPLLTGLLDMTIPEGLAGDELVEYIVNDLLDLRNGALKKYINVTDDSVTLTTNFQSLLRALLETAQGMMGTLTTYDTVEKWDDEHLEQLGRQLTEPETLAYLLRTVLTSLIDYMDIPLTMPKLNEEEGVVEEVPINGYALATYTLINVMADKMPEKDYYGMIENYKNGYDAGETLNPGFVPQNKFDEPAAFTVLSDYMYYFLNAKTTMAIPEGLTFDETLQWIFNWVLDQFGGLLRTDNLNLTTTPTASNMVAWKNMDIMLWDNVLDITWLPDEEYVSAYKDSNGNYTGNVTRTLLLDNLLYRIVDLNLTQLDRILSLFRTYQGSVEGYPKKGELSQNVIQFVLTLVKRLLNGMFQSENGLFAGTTINCLEDILSKTKYGDKTNLRWLVENLCEKIAEYGEPILMSALPLIGESLADLEEYKENYDVYPPGNPGYGISDLRSRLEEQRPSEDDKQEGDDSGNATIAAMMQNDDYHFFGSEDFDKDNLYKYYNWRKVYDEAKDLSDNYDTTLARLQAAVPAAEAEETAAQNKLDYDKSHGASAEQIQKDQEALQKMKDAVAARKQDIKDFERKIEVLTYRLDHYFGLLVYRSVDISELQRVYSRAKTDFGFGEYDTFNASGEKYSSTDFTLRTWNAYNDAYNFAKKVILKVANIDPNDPSTYVRQSMITQARQILIRRMKELKFFSDNADYSELNKMIQMATARVDESIEDPSAYVQSTIETLIQALNVANAFDRGYDGSEQNLIDDAVAALQAAYDSVIEMPQIAKATGSTTVLDKTRMVIYGMREKLVNYMAYVRNRGNGILVTIPKGTGTGTGAQIGLKLDVDGDIVQRYTVIIFGDVDGDCRADATDANWVYRYKAHLLDNAVIPDYVIDAADANGDGVVDYVDAYYLRQSGLQKFTVNQRGTAA